MSLLTEPDAFFTDHHDCDDLDAGVEGPIVWIACECSARKAVGHCAAEIGEGPMGPRLVAGLQ